MSAHLISSVIILQTYVLKYYTMFHIGIYLGDFTSEMGLLSRYFSLPSYSNFYRTFVLEISLIFCSTMHAHDDNVTVGIILFKFRDIFILENCSIICFQNRIWYEHSSKCVISHMYLKTMSVLLIFHLILERTWKFRTSNLPNLGSSSKTKLRNSRTTQKDWTSNQILSKCITYV